MPITFRTPAHGDVTYLGDVAHTLIDLMGHSGTVPGAVAAEDVPRALARLRQGLRTAARPPSPPPAADEDDEDEDVPLTHRAAPLIELLEAAVRAGEYVMWDTPS